MFKTLLASLGVGAAKIDLILDDATVTMGQPVNGKLVLTGGNVGQKIEKLTVEFHVTSAFQRGDQTIYVDDTVSTIPVTMDSFTIHPGEVQEFSFSFVCPAYLPVSSVHTRYDFRSNLAIAAGIDAKDRDTVVVRPQGLLRNFLEGFQRLGFIPRSEGYTGIRNGGVQIIQFQPTDWMRGAFDEVVFSYTPARTQERIEGHFELDKKTQGLIGMLADHLDLDEKKGYFRFEAAELATVEQAAETIKRFIERNTQGLITG
ncbi:sporulation protein [Polycladomyces subterraneus]|uniref:Sporulation protein n=1 Tax=Polycladomyces subterraneus TaxID=1016997 RepID=A0ABT8IN80_9BACL|nr:sporulation protein [Polycladomyces subterraneus]MDN4594263.1 sporulation protein [Polycladomyces subterraneus]